jgi:hypothetical protein
VAGCGCGLPGAMDSIQLPLGQAPSKELWLPDRDRQVLRRVRAPPSLLLTSRLTQRSSGIAEASGVRGDGRAGGGLGVRRHRQGHGLR